MIQCGRQLHKPIIKLKRVKNAMKTMFIEFQSMLDNWNLMLLGQMGKCSIREVTFKLNPKRFKHLEKVEAE